MSNSAKGFILKSIFGFKYPRCQSGPLFKEGSLLKPASLLQMYKHCPKCNQSYEPEPGFYFGAMFVSYAINTALFIAAWVALTVIYPDYSLGLLLGILVLVVILGLPLTYRLSRSIWLAIFVRFDPNAGKT
ncbi:DUF983 domain-containing protein [Algoriphagus hitonicola]|uniref:DUF983 domain-containing protein n=1 Tax=Algoriphagus hitonicola TaxID=435880 RepID=A0A1I2U2V1_9BACT|nr:DUF983 domain-containing protein [Algoriphagus hitonicola]SFG71448.1 Protein of unknown function [Algoriphagus hitonicola]